MKNCPDCDFENFENFDLCDGCGRDIRNVRHEFFTIVGFVKKNSELYAAIGIFLGLFQYFVISTNQIVRSVSLIPLFFSGFLMFSLIIKGNQIVETQPFNNPRNRFFNSNSFELWVFLAINTFLIIGLVGSTGTEYILSICLLGASSLAIFIFVRRISSTDGINTFSLNIFAFLLIEVGLFALKFILPYVRTTSDPTIFFWGLMTPLSFLFFGFGSLVASLFISEWLAVTEMRTLDQRELSFARLHEEMIQYVQPFTERTSIQVLTGITILGAIILGCLYSNGILG